MTTPRLSLPTLAPAQAAKHIIVNEALTTLDAAVQLTLAGEAFEPPANAADGVCLRVSADATGAFAGRDGTVAARALGQWRFLEPQSGWRAWDLETGTILVFDGMDWVEWGGGRSMPDSLSHLGIGTDADSLNPLSVRGDSTLLSAGNGGSHRLSINRASSRDSASVLFQTGFVGKAEIGLTQGGGLAFRAHTAQSGWVDALSVDADSGTVSANGLSTGRSMVRVFGPGTGQYAVPDGVVALDVVAQGGGGGGAGAHVPNVSVLAGAGGGGAGGHVKARITGSALQQSYTYTVGAGGAGGPSLPVAGETRCGEDGGDTQFGSGVAALFASGGMGAPERIANGGYRHYLPGEGGSASGGDLAIAGQPGSSGTTYGSLNVITGSQAGGSSLLGGGGVPRPGNGLDATGYGAGGAGAGMTPKVVLAASGGAGSDGVLLLTEYY